MNENKRRSIVLIIITIATISLVAAMATYAYFLTERNLGGVVNANVRTAASMYSFSATSNGNININIDFNEMSEANVNTTVLKTDNAIIDVSLASPTNGMKTTCTYDIVWVWESTGENVYDTSSVAPSTLPYTKDGVEYKYEFSTKVDENEETDLSSLTNSNGKVVLKRGESIESSSTTAISKRHTITANIYNIPYNQTALFGKTFKAHITVENLNCNMESGSTQLAKYWNNNFEYVEYAPPGTLDAQITPSEAYDSVAELQASYSNFSNQPFYIKTTEEKHEVCLYYNNKEFCLGEGYWVAEDTDGSKTKTKLQTEMASAFGQEEIYLICSSDSFYADCYVGGFSCYASSYGDVHCYGNGSDSCYVGGGYARCSY